MYNNCGRIGSSHRVLQVLHLCLLLKLVQVHSHWEQEYLDLSFRILIIYPSCRRNLAWISSKRICSSSRFYNSFFRDRTPCSSKVIIHNCRLCFSSRELGISIKFYSHCHRYSELTCSSSSYNSNNKCN